MRIYRRILQSLFVLIITTLALLPAGVANAETGDVFVPETGHWVRGEFLSLYQSVIDPLRVFGYPITDEMVDPLSGMRVQYFQKVRMDLTIGGTGITAQPAPLGQLLYTAGAPLAPLPLSVTACRLFDSGKPVCYAFLQFYDDNNGAFLFGNPISDMEFIDGRFVQYFEKARFEWWPENPNGQRVLVSDLGRLYFDIYVGDPTILQPVLAGNLIETPVKLQVNVFAAYALIPAGAVQTIYIVTQNQRLEPLQGVDVIVKVRYPDGSEDNFRPRPTNEAGFSELTFTVPALAPDQMVNLEITTAYNGQIAAATSWFRIWW